MILIIRPHIALAASYITFIDEMRKRGEKIWDGMEPKDGEGLPHFVESLLLSETIPDAGLVPQTTYWACKDDVVVGRIALRHFLTEDLTEFGGHIGYEVHPLFRKMGIAKEMLRQVLQTEKAKSIGKLLLTCAPNNIASNKTILANGGVLTKTVFAKKQQRDTNYYWIDATQPKS